MRALLHLARSGASGRLLGRQAQLHAQLARQARPALPGRQGLRAAQAGAVVLHRALLEHAVVQQTVHGVLHRFVQLVGEGLADQLVGDQVGHRGIQRDQRLAEVGDVAVVDLLDQAVGQVGFVEQGIQALMALHDARRAEEELLGQLQHRLDLLLDTGFAGHAVGGVEHVRYLLDIGGDEAFEHATGVAGRQLDGRVQLGQLALQLLRQGAAVGFMGQCLLDLFAQCEGIHDGSCVEDMIQTRVHLSSPRVLTKIGLS
ncbi:conserved hypothetical protein [Pseudomonas sp. 8AS]|nr:conserved hypothetical protein [Pseudomonas sp. 8AS]